MISVVIPSAGTPGPDGRPLLAGALHASTAADEVLVVVTNAVITDLAQQAIDAAANARRVDVTREGFNFSSAVNAGAGAALAQDVILLNDDVALTRSGSPDWPQRLASKPGHVIGVKLLDPSERRIEHAGVGFTAGGAPGHLGQDHPPGAARGDVRVLAVTGAVMLVRRRQFLALGGFDEAFPVNYGDVDFCLRAGRRKLRVTQANSIALVHRESSTRGQGDVPNAEDCRLLADRHRSLLRANGIGTHHLEAFAAAAA